MTTFPVISRFAVMIVGLLGVLPASARNADLPALLLGDETGRIPEEVAGFRLVAARQDEAIHFVFTLDPARPTGENLVELVLTPRDEARPAFARSASFNIEYRGPMVGGQPAPEVRPLTDALIASITRNDPGGILIAPPKPRALGEGGEVPTHVFVADRVAAWTGVLLVALFLVCLPWTGQRLGRDVRTALARDGPKGFRFEMGFAMASVAVGLILRLSLPHLPVMYYMGYHLAETAGRLEGIPKYGPGALALYHLVFRLTGTDHLAMMYANSVLGAFIPIAGGALLARLGFRGWSVASGIAFLSLGPLFVKDATTESLLVPTTLWMLSGLVLFLAWREERRTSTLSLALLHLILAMFSRPEAVVLVPVTSGLLVLARWKAHKTEMPRDSSPAWPWLVSAVLLLIRAGQLWVSLDIEFARGNNPILKDPAGLLSLLPDLWRRNVLLWPSLYPVAVTVLACAGLVLGPLRLVTAALLLASTLWIGASLVDLPFVSIARVQVPGAVFCTLAAGAAVAGVIRVVSGKRVALVLASVGLVLAVAASMLYTVPGLWAPVNPDHEERLWRDAREVIPGDRPFILIRRGYNDQPVERLHLYNPDYWFEPPTRQGLCVGPDWFARTDTAGRAAYFLLGTRCYMRKCGETGLHPACRRILENYRLEPVIERTVPVHTLPIDRSRRPDQELDFPWCLAQTDAMKIGLYLLREKRVPASVTGP